MAQQAGSKDPDWAVETVDKLQSVIDKVRSQTTDRLVSISRILVFGLLAAVMGLMSLVLVVIAFIKLVNVVTDRPWLTYLIVGAIFTGFGLLLWSKKEPRPAKA